MALMRRLAILALAAVLSFSAVSQEKAPAAAAPAVAGPTPDQLWAALLQGNKSFAAGRISFDTLKDERLAMRDSQAPPITVLACSDSRVPPELVFNQSLGALYVIRTAGNVADDFGIASIEFALLQGYTRLVVVLGHENCGAVRAALGGADPSTAGLTELAKRIRSSFIGVPYDSRDAANVKRATEMNAYASAAYLLASSRLLRDAMAGGRVKLVAAYYDMQTGEVRELK